MARSERLSGEVATFASARGAAAGAATSGTSICLGEGEGDLLDLLREVTETLSGTETLEDLVTR